MQSGPCGSLRSLLVLFLLSSLVAHREGKISLFKDHSSRLHVQQKGIINGQISVHSEQHTEGSSSSCREGRAEETMITDRQTYKVQNEG